MKVITKKLFLSVCLCFIVFIVLIPGSLKVYGSINTEEVDFTGTKKENGIVYYYENGKKFTGDRKINGVSYYYKNGKKFTGDRKIKDISYYYEKGKKFDGIREVKGKKFLYKSGKKYTGDYKTGNKTYYYENGIKTSVYIIIEKEKTKVPVAGYKWIKKRNNFYFVKDANLVKGWYYLTKKDGEKVDHFSYFEKTTGRLYTGLRWMGNKEGEKTGHYSYFGDNGWLRTLQIVNVKNNRYSADSKGWLEKSNIATNENKKKSFKKIVDAPDMKSYAYAPSVFIANGNTHIFFAGNYSENRNITRDTIYYTNKNYANRNRVLAPNLSNKYASWDSYHVCDPSVVQGDFRYAGKTYKYAMAYLGIGKNDNCIDCYGNEIGLAVSNNLSKGWVRAGKIVAHDTIKGNWGVGQPSLMYVKNKLILFFTGEGSTRVIRINPKTMKSETPVGKNAKTAVCVSRKGLETWMHNADFAFKNDRIYVVYEGKVTGGDFISDNLYIKSAAIKDLTDVNAYKNLQWTSEGEINIKTTGYRKNTNGAFLRNLNGSLNSRKIFFTSTNINANAPWGHFHYDIFSSIF